MRPHTFGRMLHVLSSVFQTFVLWRNDSSALPPTHDRGTCSFCFASLCESRAFWVSRHQDDILHIYCTRANNPTKATFLLEQKISGGRVRAPWKRRCCGVFFSMKVSTSPFMDFLPQRGGGRAGGGRMQMWGNRVLWSEWAPAVRHSHLKSARHHRLPPVIIMGCQMSARGGEL